MIKNFDVRVTELSVIDFGRGYLSCELLRFLQG